MPEKQTNRASIVFAVIALLFILGGVYLLNRSVNPGTEDETADTPSTTIDTSSPIGTDRDDDTGTSTSVASNEEEADTDDLDTAIAQEDELASSDDEEPTEDTTNDIATPEDPDQNAQTSTTPEPAQTPLTPDQMTATFIGLDGGDSLWEITDCGIPNAQSCVPGARMRLNGIITSDKIAGEEYLFTGDIEEQGQTFIINVINTVEPIS